MGEYNIQGMVIATLLAFGLFFAVIGGMMTRLDNNYDTSGYDEAVISKYNQLDSLSSTINQSGSIIDTQVNVDKNAFDYFANIWQKVTTPFKFIYRSYETLITVIRQGTTDLKLMPEFTTFLVASLIVIVLIGIVMIKFYLGRGK